MVLVEKGVVLGVCGLCGVVCNFNQVSATDNAPRSTECVSVRRKENESLMSEI